MEAAESFADGWETKLSAYAIYNGNEYGLTITDVSATGGGLLSVSISADSLPSGFIRGWSYVDVKIMCGGKPISGSIRLAAVVDESDVLNMLNRFDSDGDGQIVDDLGEKTGLSIYQDWDQWILPYLNLILSEMPALTVLDCSYDSSLTTLDLSNCPALKTLNFYRSSLTTLDLSSNPALKTLNFYRSSLTTLDLSSNPALKVLYCGTNSLTTLDLSHNPVLEVLDCYENNLTTLDLSNCSALTLLMCDKNSLTTLDLSNYTSLSKLSVDLTTKLIVSVGFSVGQAYSLVGQYVSVGGVTGVVCNINPVKIVSTDEISASWEDDKDWCTSKGPDWYLPTLDDFYFCWYYDPNRTLSSIGGVELDEKSYYWSSDYCDTGAYGIKCYSSQVYDTGTLLKVRAVRAL